MISEAIASVVQRIQKAAVEAARKAESVRLVAVSKTKPNESILEAYNGGHRVFGENYVQELVKKAEELPKDIQWHFIGHIQSGKVKDLCQVSNLALVETIDSAKLADAFQKRLVLLEKEQPLPVLVQVNTSEEDSKSGVKPNECLGLVKYIIGSCSKLKVRGLMTIGKFGEPGEKYFNILSQLKTTVLEDEQVKKYFGEETFELSMGMSADFEEAIKLGSTNVRVGSTIFGAREKKQ